MYRKVDDFLLDWNISQEGTLNVFKAMTNDKLDQSIVEGHNSLHWLANHIVGSIGSFGGFAGFNLPKTEPSSTVNELINSYEAQSEALKNEAARLTDESLLEEIDGFTGKIPRGQLLRSFIDHQTHHRGQMTVLLRQANLTVPPVMGPTKEMQ